MISDVILQTLVRAASATPPKTRLALARRLAWLDFHAAHRRRVSVLANLDQIARTARPDLRSTMERQRTARTIFESYHRVVLECLAHQAGGSAGVERKVRLRGMEILYRAVAAGRGAVIVAPHLGNWELAGLALARLGFAVHVVTGIQYHPRLTGAVRRLKERERIRVSTPADGFAPLLRTLRAGGIVVLLADGDVFRRSIPAEFFDRAVPFPVGPALLARRAAAPLVSAHATRDAAGRHTLSFDGLERPDASRPVREDLRRLTARAAASLERSIAAHVDQWCIFRPVFPDAPTA